MKSINLTISVIDLNTSADVVDITNLIVIVPVINYFASSMHSFS